MHHIEIPKRFDTEMKEIQEIRNAFEQAVRIKSVPALQLAINLVKRRQSEDPKEAKLLVNTMTTLLKEYQSNYKIFKNTYHDMVDHIVAIANFFEKAEFPVIKLRILLQAVNDFLKSTELQRDFDSKAVDETLATEIDELMNKYRGQYAAANSASAAASPLNAKDPYANSVNAVVQMLTMLFREKIKAVTLDDGIQNPTNILIKVRFEHAFGMIDMGIQNAIKTLLQNIYSDALYAACKNGFAEGVPLLLNMGVDVNKPHLYPVGKTGFNSETPLYAAYMNFHDPIVKILASHPQTRHQYLLHLACSHDRIDVIKFLLSRKDVGINKRDAHIKATPIFIACMRNDIDVVKLLLSREDVDISRLARDGRNPFEVTNSAEIKNLLISYLFRRISEILKQGDFLSQRKEINKFVVMGSKCDPKEFCTFIRNLFLNPNSKNFYSLARQYFLLHEILVLPNTSELAQLRYDLADRFYVNNNPILAYLFFDKANLDDAELWKARCVLSSMRIETFGKELSENWMEQYPNEYVKAIVKTRLMSLYLQDPACCSAPETAMTKFHAKMLADKRKDHFAMAVLPYFKEAPLVITQAIAEFIEEQKQVAYDEGCRNFSWSMNAKALPHSCDDLFFKPVKHQRASAQVLSDEERDQACAGMTN